MKRNLPVLLAILLLAAFGIYAGVMINRKVSRLQDLVEKQEVLVNASQFLLAERARPFTAEIPLKVVCLGNSITRHGRLADIEWYSDWGMAASKEENDYCHVLQRKLRKYNGESTVVPLNIAAFERDPACDLDSLLGNVCDGADIIVIRLGENVQHVGDFKDNLQRLIDKCKNYTPDIVITGRFWTNGTIEKALLNAASDNGLHFVPLSWISEMMDAYPKNGDTLYDVDGKPYVVTKDFILTHPNDEGMRAIANALFNAITLIETEKNGK